MGRIKAGGIRRVERGREESMTNNAKINSNGEGNRRQRRRNKRVRRREGRGG